MKKTIFTVITLLLVLSLLLVGRESVKIAANDEPDPIKGVIILETLGS